VNSGVFKGGRCDAPLWPTMKIFLQATLYEKVGFSPFSSKNCKIPQCLMVFFSYRYSMRLCDYTLYFAKTTQISVIFCVSKFQKNGRICGFHWTFKSNKYFSFRGASPPDPLTRGSAPGPRRGLRPQTPVIGSRSPWPPLLPNPKYTTGDEQLLRRLIRPAELVACNCVVLY